MLKARIELLSKTNMVGSKSNSYTSCAAQLAGASPEEVGHCIRHE